MPTAPGAPLPPALLRSLVARGVDASLSAARFSLPGDVAERDDASIMNR